MTRFTLGQLVEWMANGRLIRGEVVAHVAMDETPDEAVARCKARPRPVLRPETKARNLKRSEPSYIVSVPGRRYAYFPPVKALSAVQNVAVALPVARGDRRGK